MELFDVWLSPLEGNQFKIIVKSNAGEAEDDSLLPFWEDGKDWRNTIIKVIESQDGFKSDFFSDPDEQDWMVRYKLLDEDRQRFHPSYIKYIGQALYNSLFPHGSDVRQSLNSSLRILESNSNNSHLHICLKCEEYSAKRTSIASYPWELLHDGQRFLLHHRVSLSRYIAKKSVPSNFYPQDKIHVLLVASRAEDEELGLKPLTQLEQNAIRNGLIQAQKDGLIRLSRLRIPTQKELQDHLTGLSTDDAIPHVLHFDGHGLFGKLCVEQGCSTMHKGIKAERCRRCNSRLPEAEGYLVFEKFYKGKSKPDYVKASSLGALLQSTSLSDSDYHHRISLVVLTACQSAMALEGDSIFNGVAQNLIDHQVPAVVAMQYSIRADAASNFSEQFYRSLGKRNSLSTAIHHGRVAMLQGNGHQWFRPVLYLRWKDNEGGQLFKESKPQNSATDETSLHAFSVNQNSVLDDNKNLKAGQKIALLIGVKQYGVGFKEIPGAERDVQVFKQILESSNLGNFDQVISLIDPNVQDIEQKIDLLIGKRSEKDLVLLYFSGHGVKNSNNTLFLTTCKTQKNSQGELDESTAISAQFIHDAMDRCNSKQQIIILDCCFSGAFSENLLVKDDGSIDLKNQLGGEGRVILTSSTSLENSFATKSEGSSIYTKYLVQGIQTGEADLNGDQRISIQELHDYIQREMKKEMPSMTPGIYTTGEGARILLARVPDTPIDWSAFEIPKGSENFVESSVRTGGQPNYQKIAFMLSATIATISFLGLLMFVLMRLRCSSIKESMTYTEDSDYHDKYVFDKYIDNKNHPQRKICELVGPNLPPN
ncbi:CHAT domain-containing protein [Nodosilinea sp. LEGE 07088]|uniref:caspase, EACC1-associated type n=1 Tax=Nodosilinea sp. LEGE 07088 TaxID=2777968 RepID=UPI00187E08C1|nr:CHAT domain-containing protein [Nodosilinea sp. LEGE 07088]MBE9136933.1 CHAT domain-containing protein [Nodosilinea sp. LEGE 07088]